jgi:hypothetical protein
MLAEQIPKGRPVLRFAPDTLATSPTVAFDASSSQERRKSTAELRLDTVAALQQEWASRRGGDPSSSSGSDSDPDLHSDDHDLEDLRKVRARLLTAEPPSAMNVSSCFESFAVSSDRVGFGEAARGKGATSTHTRRPAPLFAVRSVDTDLSTLPAGHWPGITAFEPKYSKSDTNGDGPAEAVKSGAVRWYRDKQHVRGWSPGTAVMEARPLGSEQVRQASGGSVSRPISRQSCTPPPALMHMPTPSAASRISPGPSGNTSSRFIAHQLRRPPSALHVSDKVPPIGAGPASGTRPSSSAGTPWSQVTRVSATDRQRSRASGGHREHTSSRAGDSCVRCATKAHQEILDTHNTMVSHLIKRLGDEGSEPTSARRSPLKVSKASDLLRQPPGPLVVSMRALRRTQREQARQVAAPTCLHDATGNCALCDVTRGDIATFECLAMESAQARLGEGSALAKPMAVESDDDDDDDNGVNAHDAGARAAARRQAEYDAMLRPLRARWRHAERAAVQAQYGALPQPDAPQLGSDAPHLRSLGERARGTPNAGVPPFGKQAAHVTVADLFSGTSHRDRENLYISVVGGLSLDLTREKFRTMVVRVLAPRLGVQLSDEQVLHLFSHFDINNGGTVSFFEYLTALCERMLTAKQRRFFSDLYLRLRAAATTTAVRLARRQQLLDTAASVRAAPSAAHDTVDHGKSDGAPVNPDRLPYFVSRKPDGAPQLGSDKGVSLADMSLARMEQSVFDLLNKSLMFPHPAEAQLAAVIHACFTDLSPADRIEEPKFVLLLFCDDDVMRDLPKHVN